MYVSYIGIIHLDTHTHICIYMYECMYALSGYSHTYTHTYIHTYRHISRFGSDPFTRMPVSMTDLAYLDDMKAEVRQFVSVHVPDEYETYTRIGSVR